MTNVRLKRKAKGERPYFFSDPNVDKVIAMVMGLAGEVAVMRDRLDTVERLLDAGKAMRRADIDTYQPNAAVAAERAAWRESFLGEVLRIVEIEIEALASGDTAPYQEAIALVEPVPAARRRTRASKPAMANKQPAQAPAARKKKSSQRKAGARS